MKNILKTLTLVLLAVLSVFTLVACGGAKDAEILASYLLKQDEKVVSEDFVLENSLTFQGKTYDLTWVSSNTAVISLEKRDTDYLAKITFPAEETTVKLTVSLGKANKEFSVTVQPIDVYSFSGAYAFPKDKQVVVDNFSLDRSVTVAGKQATITWSVDEAYRDFINISEDGNQCIVTQSSLNPEVKIKATFSYNNETTTKSYRMTVSKVLTSEELVDYWYSNTGISQKISGYVVAKGNWKEYNGVYEAILCVLDDSGLCGYYLYLEPTELNKEAFAALQIGAHVTNEGSVNTLYNGLYETSNYKGKTVLDADVEIKQIVPFAIDNDLINTNSSVAKYMQSTLVSLTNWQVKEVKEWSTASGSNTILVLTKGGVDVPVVISKYFLLEPDSLAADTTIIPAIHSSIEGLAAGDYVNVTGILSNYNGPQIVAHMANSITRGEADTTEAAQLPGNIVKPIMKQNHDAVPDGLVTTARTITFAASTENVQIAYEILGRSNSVTLNENVATVTPANAEYTTIKITYTCGTYSTWELVKIKSQSVDDLGMIEIEKNLLKDFAVEKTTELQTKGKTFDDVTISWSLKEAVEGVSIENNKLVCKGGLDVEAVLVARLTCGNAVDSVEVTVSINTPEVAETGTWADPLSPKTAILLAGQLDGSTREKSTDWYYVKGTIATDPTSDYCNFDFIDGETHLVVYGLWNGADDSKRYGSKREIAELPVKNGDTVLLYCQLQNFDGKLELINSRLIANGETYITEEDKQVISYQTAMILASRLDASTREKSTHKYLVKGTIATDPTSDYCNFDFIDGETHLVVYGLWDYNGDNRYGSKREIAELPVKNGDEVVLFAQLQNFDGKLELVNARLYELNGESQKPAEEVKLNHAGTEADPYDVADAVAVANNGGSGDNVVYVQGVVDSSSFAEGKNYTIWLKDGDKKFELYHVTLDAAIEDEKYHLGDALKGGTVVCEGKITLHETTAEISEGKVVGLEIEEKEAADVSGAPLLAKGTGSAYDDVTVNDNAAIKLGTGSTGGTMVVTVKAGATKVQFYAVAWKNKPAVISVSGVTVSEMKYNGVAVEKLTLTAVDGATSNSPFTVEGDLSAYLVELTLTGVTEQTTFVVSTDIEDNARDSKRALFWGASYGE